MQSTTQRDDELAQQAPLVPDIGRADDSRTDGGRTSGETTPTRRTTPSNAVIRRTNDEMAQEAPLVPNLGRPARTSDDKTPK